MITIYILIGIAVATNNLWYCMKNNDSGVNEEILGSKIAPINMLISYILSTLLWPLVILGNFVLTVYMFLTHR